MDSKERALEQIKRWEKAKEIKAQIVKENARKNRFLRDEIKDIELAIKIWKDTLQG